MPLDAILFILRIVTALALYAFLAALLVMLSRDVALASQQALAARKSAGALAVVESQDAPLDAGRRYPLTAFTTLGRAAASSIVIPDSFASNDHARVCERGGQWWLEDLNSRNGTFLNDVPVTEAMALASGDVISIGRVKLRVEF